MKNYNALITWAGKQVGKPYQWGVTDCGTTTREGLRILLGRDPFPGLPAWTNEQEMREIWGSLGGAEAGFLCYGAVRVQPGYTQTGDVALLKLKDLETATLLVNGQMLFSFEDKGVQFRSLKNLESKHLIGMRYPEQ